ncbi:MAG TPA: PTS fructose transporter subunit IIA [Erysipelotrichaceae bacterium]|jgi:PTS system mannose-specific IIA component|nr:PTS sugar transporter subunit IIA [Bacillota bacterium]NLP21613.1 PTS sugar transporter subunit IIA [Erysipelotrichaceae bacterium]HCY05759.1 PTS fructose transporter subunit IIA [Erysipelotrichaceae bacterium]
MLGIVIATHGKFSSGLKDAAEVIMGNTENMVAVSLHAGDPIEELGANIKQAILDVNKGQGVVVLVDLVSASPYNQSVLAISQLEPELQENVYIVGGVSLPVLLETINAQLLNTPIAEAVEAIKEQGRTCVDTWHISDAGDDDDDDF